MVRRRTRAATLCIGDAQAPLRSSTAGGGPVYPTASSPQANLPTSGAPTSLKAGAAAAAVPAWPPGTIARAVRDALTQCGFVVEKVPGVPPKRDNLHATFNPAWEPRTSHERNHGRAPRPSALPGHWRRTGGAASAASLARRGWQVQVLDAAAAPRRRRPGLPLGLFAPHLSPDDNVFSRVSRSGVRAMLQQSQALLQPGLDWNPGGVLERRPPDNLGLPAGWEHSPGADWNLAASPQTLQKRQTCLKTAWPAGTPPAGCPARLVHKLLAQPGIALQANARWPRCSAPPTAPGRHSTRQASRWPRPKWSSWPPARPPHPVGHRAGTAPALAARARPDVLGAAGTARESGYRRSRSTATARWWPMCPHEGGLAWYMGSTFDRDEERLPVPPAEQAAAHATNWQRLQALVPAAPPALRPAFDGSAASSLHAWASVRCTASDRLPIVGLAAPARLPGCGCTAMGAAG